MPRILVVGSVTAGLVLLVWGVVHFAPHMVSDAGKSPGEWQKEYARGDRLTMAGMAVHIRRFASTSDQLPSTLEEVPEIRRPDGGPPKDAWGIEYRYEVTGKSRFVLRSAGPDKIFGTSDDLAHGEAPEDHLLESVLKEMFSQVTPSGSQSN